IDFNQLSFGRSLSKLPIDPINTTSSGLYYTYVYNNGSELTTIFESNKYKNISLNDIDNIGGIYSIKTSNKVVTPWFKDRDLIAYWPLDENTSTLIYDYSTNSNNGSLFNGVIWRSGSNCVSGFCLEFDGIDDYVLGNIKNFDILPNKTFALWVYPIVGANGAAISFKEPNSNNDPYFNLYPHPNNIITVSVGWKSWVFDSTGFTIPGDQWSFIVLTVDNDLIKLYYNTNVIWTSPRTTLPADPPVNFKFGNRFYSNRPYKGRIDEVRIYNRVLTDTEILKLYNLGI
ncbi:MAG: LamG domain-containing protein, partial [Patescibacteria group bacterium]|nr:LamG domain-containing protein [Patescibacteria group bacterium]MDW8279951.1 LamG domain-containing protein [bacterium]